MSLCIEVMSLIQKTTLFAVNITSIAIGEGNLSQNARHVSKPQMSLFLNADLSGHLLLLYSTNGGKCRWKPRLNLGLLPNKIVATRMG